MRRDEVLSRLRTAETELRERFRVQSLALFGSTARDETTDASDVDLLVEFDRPIGLFHFVRTQDFLEGQLGLPVDLVPRESVFLELRGQIYGEAIDVLR